MSLIFKAIEAIGNKGFLADENPNDPDYKPAHYDPAEGDWRNDYHFQMEQRRREEGSPRYDATSGSGSGSSIPGNFIQSPEQKAIYNLIKPLLDRLSQRVTDPNSDPLWDLGNLPSARSFTSGVDPNVLMPDWTGLDPALKQSLMAPYKEAGNELFESMANRGQVGGMRGGMTGAFGDAYAKRIGAEAAMNVPLQAQQMMMPAKMAEYDKQYQGAMTDYGGAMESWRQGINEQQLPYSILPGMIGQTLPTPIIQAPYMPASSSSFSPFGMMSGLMGVGQMIGGK